MKCITSHNREISRKLDNFFNVYFNDNITFKEAFKDLPLYINRVDKTINKYVNKGVLVEEGDLDYLFNLGKNKLTSGIDSKVTDFSRLKKEEFEKEVNERFAEFTLAKSESPLDENTDEDTNEDTDEDIEVDNIPDVVRIEDEVEEISSLAIDETIIKGDGESIFSEKDMKTFKVTSTPSVTSMDDLIGLFKGLQTIPAYKKWIEKQLFKAIVFDDTTGTLVTEDDSELAVKRVEEFLEDNRNKVSKYSPELLKEFEMISAGELDSGKAKPASVLKQYNKINELKNESNKLVQLFRYILSKHDNTSINLLAKSMVNIDENGKPLIIKKINTRTEVTQDSETINSLENVSDLFKNIITNTARTENYDFHYDASVIGSASFITRHMRFDKDLGEEVSEVMYNLLYSDDNYWQLARDENNIDKETLTALFHGIYRTSEQKSELQQRTKNEEIEIENWRLNNSSFFESLQKINGNELTKERLRNMMATNYVKMFPIKSVSIKEDVEESLPLNLQRTSAFKTFIYPLTKIFVDEDNAYKSQSSNGAITEEIILISQEAKEIINEDSFVDGLSYRLNNNNVLTPSQSKQFRKIYARLIKNKTLKKQLIKGIELLKSVSKETNEENKKVIISNANMQLKNFMTQLMKEGLDVGATRQKSTSTSILGTQKSDFDLINQQHSIMARLNSLAYNMQPNSLFIEHPFFSMNSDGEYIANNNLFEFVLKEGMRQGFKANDYVNLNLNDTLLSNLKIWKFYKNKGIISTPYATPADKSRNYNININADLTTDIKVQQFLQSYYTNFVNEFKTRFEKIGIISTLNKNETDPIKILQNIEKTLVGKTRKDINEAVYAFNSINPFGEQIELVDGIHINEGKNGLFFKKSLYKEIKDGFNYENIAKEAELNFKTDLILNYDGYLLDDSIGGNQLYTLNTAFENALNDVLFESFVSQDKKALSNSLVSDIQTLLTVELSNFKKRGLSKVPDYQKKNLKKKVLLTLLKNNSPVLSFNSEVLQYGKDYLNNYLLTLPLTQGIKSQYKSDNEETQMIDNVKRNVSLLSNYTPYFGSKYGNDNVMYQVTIKDISTRIVGINGAFEDKDQHDGAAFEIPSQTFKNQIAVGGKIYGTAIGYANQKPLATQFDSSQGSTSLEKFAIFAMTNERILNSFSPEKNFNDLVQEGYIQDC